MQKEKPPAAVVNHDPTQLNILTALLKRTFATHGHRDDTALTAREAEAPCDVAVLDHHF